MKRTRFAAMFSVVAAVACGSAETSPPHHDAGPPDYDAGPPDHDAGETCVGICLPVIPASWFGPELVWMGAKADAPPCPSIASSEGFTGYGYPDVPISCGGCTCGQPSGSCNLPATLTAAAASCADDGPGIPHTAFDPPASWGGTCNGENAIPAGQLCGGVPCVQSVTIAPPTAKQTGCLPMAPPPVQPPPWVTFARGCLDDSFPRRCTAHDGVCVPAAPGPEFKQCITRLDDHPDDVECSPYYPNRSFFYTNPTPKCAPCACEPPQGSTCTGAISLFQDGICGTLAIPEIAISEMAPTCADLPPGSALGSKKASLLSYQPGACTPSGGAPRGRIVCCRP